VIWLPYIIATSFNLINSFIDAYKIKVLNKNIRHFINFGAYAIIAIICVWYFKMGTLKAGIYLMSLFFNRQITFDIPLNLRRGKKWDYVSTAKPPEATMDKIEVWLWGYNGRLPVLIYSLGAIILTVLYFIL